MKFPFRSSDHSPTKKQLNTLEAEIKKLENDIENMKTDMDTSRPAENADNSMSTVQAPIVAESHTAIGDVIAELKAHNQARTVQRAHKHKEGRICGRVQVEHMLHIPVAYVDMLHMHEIM